MKECTNFKAFEYDAYVCDNCGKLADAHPRSQMDDNLTKMMWRVLIAEGGVWNYYGGTFEKAESRKDPYLRGKIYHNAMAKIDIHMTACEIDWQRTERPEMTQLGEFSGTFATCDNYKTALAGELYCVCRTVFREQIGMNEITLGQLIWKVVHADDQEGEKS